MCPIWTEKPDLGHTCLHSLRPNPWPLVWPSHLDIYWSTDAPQPLPLSSKDNWIWSDVLDYGPKIRVSVKFHLSDLFDSNSKNYICVCMKDTKWWYDSQSRHWRSGKCLDEAQWEVSTPEGESGVSFSLSCDPSDLYNVSLSQLKLLFLFFRHTINVINDDSSDNMITAPCEAALSMFKPFFPCSRCRKALSPGRSAFLTSLPPFISLSLAVN